ncbi:response regulator transcription factor [Burkholderia guangdongensis]|uniref:response regulator transcription factor n=1 Tax=Burkholderia guangdongensis TaxID=1792500 RepID=UPI0015CD4FA3|nr:response regulator transcription factor [Burkholderia guangdongensis]
MKTRRNILPVLVVEDHPVVAMAIRMHLAKIDERLAVTVAASARSAVDTFRRAADWFRVFVDLSVPGACDLSLVRRFHGLGAVGRCAIVTASTQVSLINDAKRLGVLAYIVKTMPVEDFHAALTCVINGEAVFPEIASDGDPVNRLTRRQREVLSLLCCGYSSKRIADELNLAEGTVDNHVSNIMRVLGAQSRMHAVAKAIIERNL